MVAGVLATVLALSACAPTAEPPAVPEPTPEASASASAAPSASPPTVEPVSVGTEPARIVLPTIDLDEPLIGLGLNPDSTMEVPEDFDEVGWFTGGGRPGGFGPVVIAGHVDSPTGPAVFLRLRDLRPGDPVHITDVDGVVHQYVVTETADYPKSDFPTARVFGATTADDVRLITCGGIFDRDAASYTDNHVVYASRAQL